MRKPILPTLWMQLLRGGGLTQFSRHPPVKAPFSSEHCKAPIESISLLATVFSIAQVKSETEANIGILVEADAWGRRPEHGNSVKDSHRYSDSPHPIIRAKWHSRGKGSVCGFWVIFQTQNIFFSSGIIDSVDPGV